jgi:hypothetical protein
MLLFVGWIASSNVKKSLVSSDKSLQTIFDSSGNDSHEYFDLFCSYSKSLAVCLRGFFQGAGHPKSWPLTSWTCCSWSEDTIDLFLLGVPLWVLDNKMTNSSHCFQKCVRTQDLGFWYEFLPAVLNRKSCTKSTPKGADQVGQYGS